MESFDIRNVLIEDDIFINFYLDKQIKDLLLSKNDDDIISKKHILSYSIRYISNKKLLENTKQQFEKITKITTEKKDLNGFYFENFIRENYTEIDLVKIEAHFYSLYYLFRLQKNKFIDFCKEQRQEFPEFMFKINNHIITHNFDEIHESCATLMLNNSINLIDKLNLNKENEIKKYLNAVNRNIEMDKETKKKFLDYYTIAKENLIKEKPILLETKLPEDENILDKMYFKVGLLFAEKKIYSKIVSIDNYKTTKYCYLDEVFDNPSQLSKRLNLTRQYINDSFTNADSKHNIFKSPKQLKNIIDYCKKNTLTIDTEFLNKYSSLIENRQ